MSNFINYNDIDFKINDQVFYADNISLSAKASVAPVLLSDGTLFRYERYAPEGAVVGSLSCSFYLTGTLPDYLCIMGNQDESALAVSFAGVDITGVYPKIISFDVQPFQPILISADFDWYGNVNVSKFKEQSNSEKNSKIAPTYVANGYRSYITTEDIFTKELTNEYVSGPSGPILVKSYDKIGFISSFSYSASCDRPAFYHVDSEVPFRVAKSDIKCEMKISSNSLGELISTKGKEAQTFIYLRDFYSNCLTSFKVSGVMTDQNYSVSNGQYLLTDASIMQVAGYRRTEV